MIAERRPARLEQAKKDSILAAKNDRQDGVEATWRRLRPDETGMFAANGL